MDDFGEFTSAFNDNNNTTEALKGPAFVETSDGFNFSLDSFQFPLGGEGNGEKNADTVEFADFSGFGQDVHVAGGVAFEIPPLPYSPPPPPGEDGLASGDMPFDIPPLTDFSLDVGNNTGMATSAELGTDASTTINGMPQALSSSSSDFTFSQKAAEILPPDGHVSTAVAAGTGADTDTVGLNSTSREDSTRGDTAAAAAGSAVAHANGEAPAAETIGGNNFGEFSAFKTGESDFGNFSAFSETKDSIATTGGGDGLGGFGGISGGNTGAMATAATTGGDDDFGEFGGGSGGNTGATATGGGDEFGGDSRGNTGATATGGDDDFGEFGGFSGGNTGAMATGGDDDFGEFGGFSGGNTGATATGGDDNFGEFGGFSGGNIGATATGGDDDFGEFGGFSGGNTGATATGGDDFGEFGGFSGGNTGAMATGGDDDFGEFGGFSGGNTGTAATIGGDDDFGDFRGGSGQGDEFPRTTAPASTKEDDEFRNFSSTATSGKDGVNFGDFSTTEVKSFGDLPSVSHHHSQKSFTVPLNNIVKSSVKIIPMCFIEVKAPHDPSTYPTVSPLSRTLLKDRHPQPSHLQEDKRTDDPKEGKRKSLWLVLQKCIDLTIPLYKFESSYLQKCYYISLPVDPLLISKPSALSILTGLTKFEAPLGGTTAMEDLRESFGFEGNLPEVGSPINTNTNIMTGSEFRRRSEDGPALLDLSFPLSPGSPTRDDTFTLAADLAGLDLNTKPKPTKLTSIQELLLNERLVVNQSTWVDSQLADLEGGDRREGEGESSHQQLQQQQQQQQQEPSRGGRDNSSPVTTPRPGSAGGGGKRTGNNFEHQLQQLGLDVTKTTLLNRGSSAELSLSARSVLGRLPDLSFMLSTDKVQDTPHYRRGHSQA